MNDVTQILVRLNQGDRAATNDLLPVVYEELRQLAAAKLKNDGAAPSLDATALVHEAYIRLVDSESASDWSNRAHFFGAAAEAMRRILIDEARSRMAQKRGGNDRTLSLDTVGPLSEGKADELVQLNDALILLEAQDPIKAQLVKLKFFVGTTTSEAAKILNLPLRTAERNWSFARAWLYRQMAESD